MLQLNINTDAAVIFTNKLEKMHKSALPVAIREALNKTAFEMKQKELQKRAMDAFERREGNFFKRFSKVSMAEGFDVNAMRAIVGFEERGLKGNKNFAVKDLEQQESGGKIAGKTFIPLNAARKGNSWTGMVSAKNRLSKIQRIINAKNAKGVNDKQKFIKSVFFAGVGGYVIGELRGDKILWRVNSLKRKDTGGFKLTPLYSVEKHRSVRVKATEFAQKAALLSAIGTGQHFMKAAQKQIERLK